MRTITRILAVSALAAAIMGCVEDVGAPLQPAQPKPDATALFNPAPTEGSAADFLPFPTDLGFAGSTDGSINVPTGGNPALASLNTLDGFSTSATMVIRFDGPINPATLSTGLRILRTDTKNPGPHFTSLFPIPAVTGQLIWGIDYVAGVLGGNSVLITLLKPLESNATYIVMVRDTVQTTSGNAVQRDQVYGLIQQLAADESIFPSGTPIAFNSTMDGPCNVLAPATFATCVPNPALNAVHGGSLAVAVQLETLRQITRNHLDAVATFDGAPSVAAASANVVLSHSVSTQNLTAAVDNAFANAALPTLGVVDTGLTSPGGFAKVYAGTLSGLTQYLDPEAPNTSTWKGAQGACPAPTDNLVMCNGYIPVPEASALTIPVLVTAPTQGVVDAICGSVSELPVVIFQHGITSNRGSLLAFADRLAGQCVVGVAIDLPKHGITSASTLGATPIGGLSLSALERLVKTDSEATGCTQTASAIPYQSGEGFHCVSGDNFINLTNLANSRDTLRQGAVDLNGLFRALDDGQLTGAMLGLSKDPDDSNIHFVGMSLGGIVGAPFVARQGDLQTASFSVMGGGIAKILDGSASFEPAITSGLYQAAEIMKPSGAYEGFLILAQTLVDSADPINYASTISGSLPVLVHEVIGDPTSLAGCLLDSVGCSDLVVPNNVFGASFGLAWGTVSGTGQTSFLAGQNFVTAPVALAGTDPFAQGTSFVLVNAAVDAGTAALIGPIGAPFTAIPGGGLTFLGLNAMELGASDTSTSPTGASIVRFSKGTHSSLLDPSVPKVNALMQQQIASFVRSSGASVVADPDAGTSEQVVRLD
jgi:pimeloyl-ACP methyl ester carboxylesterase